HPRRTMMYRDGGLTFGLNRFVCAAPDCVEVEEDPRNPHACFGRCPFCLTRYCSTACQKAHWRRHKTWCRVNAWRQQLLLFLDTGVPQSEHICLMVTIESSDSPTKSTSELEAAIEFLFGVAYRAWRQREDICLIATSWRPTK